MFFSITETMAQIIKKKSSRKRGSKPKGCEKLILT